MGDGMHPYCEGYSSYAGGLSLDDNPSTQGTWAHDKWIEGWIACGDMLGWTAAV